MEGDANAKKVIDAKIGEDVVFDRYEFCTFTAHGERVRLVAINSRHHVHYEAGARKRTKTRQLSR
jgi:hypothetical protein